MTIRLFLLFMLLPQVFSFAVLADDEETGSIAGRVTIEGDGPAPGANVVLLETRFGTAVRADGTFTLRRIPAGTYRVQARLVGYEQTKETTVEVTPGRQVVVDILLRQTSIEMNTVTVTAGRRQKAEDVRPSVTTIAPAETKFLPGAAEDVLRSLQALPGVTSVNDFSSQLVIRGSGPDQNLILIDDFEVLNPYRLYGFVSMFNPETISDISLQTGGFGARYGDRLSAVLDVRNREGRTDVWAGGKLNASLTNMNLVLEGGLPVKGASYLISARRTYYDLILGPVLKSMKLVDGDVALPNFRDFQGRVNFPFGGEHKVALNVFTSRDGVSLISGVERDRPDSVNVFDVSTNTLLGATWQYTPSPDFILQSQLSWYQNRGDGVFDGTFVDPSQNTGDLGRGDTVGIRFLSFGLDYDYLYQKYSWGQKLLWNLGAHTLEAGYGIDWLRTDFTRYYDIDQTFREFLEGRGLAIPTDALERLTYQRYNVFVQDRIAVGDRVFIQPGLRLDVYPNLRRELYVSPRVNVSYRLDDLSTLRAAYGMYFQSPGMEKLDLRTRVLFTEQAFAGLVAEHAHHYVLGYDRMITPEWQFKVESYYKDFLDVIEPQKLPGSAWSVMPTGGDPLTTAGWGTPALVPSDSLTSLPVNDATGSSYGFEVMFQKIRSLPSDRFTGWVSYALSFADRLRDGIRSPFLFDQRHAMNVVGNYRFAESWDIGMRFTLRSGRPFVNAEGVQPRVVVVQNGDQSFPVVQTDAQGRVLLDPVYERFTLSGRLNLYHSLDVRITTYPRWFGLRWALYLDVQNVYNRQNEQQVQFYVDDAGTLQRREIYGIPIFPSLGMSLDF